jgi:hypothetical protein
MSKPGYIYAANVITYNGYEGIKVGMTTRTPAQRYKEHRASGDFRKFEPINAWPVPAVRFIEGWIQGVLDQPTVAIAPGFREVYTATVSPEMVAEMAAHLANDRDAEYKKVLDRYNKLHPTDPTGPPWPNRPHYAPQGTLAAPVSDLSWALWMLMFFVLSPVLMFCLFYVVKVIAIFCAGMAWFFSTYTMPFLIGAAWVALCAVPITACVLIYRYGMNAAEETRHAKQNADFPTANPLTN